MKNYTAGLLLQVHITISVDNNLMQINPGSIAALIQNGMFMIKTL